MKFLARLNAFFNADRGASLVELALVLPTLLLLLFGAVDFSSGYRVSVELTSAAHAGAEYGSQYPSDTAGITAAAQHAAPNLASLTVGTPTWGCECSDGTSYTASCTTTPTCSSSSTRGTNVVHRVQVTASTTYHTLVPWKVISSSFTLSNTATMRGN